MCARARAATELCTQQQTNPLLARIDVRAGHGGGKPKKKIVSALEAPIGALEPNVQIEERTDIYRVFRDKLFIFKNQYFRSFVDVSF